MMKTNPEQLISWLKYLDIEYLDDDLCQELTAFDINDIDDQAAIIELAIVPEFRTLHDISKQSLLRILGEVPEYPEAAVNKLLARVGMPFKQELKDYRGFFEKVRQRITTDEK